jgi:hypothetical protein
MHVRNFALGRTIMNRRATIVLTGVALLGLAIAARPQPSFAQSPAFIPDFSGIWAHPSLPGFEPPAAGPGPVVNRSRMRTGPQAGRSSFQQFVGDYTNPVLKPQAAEVVKKRGEIELNGEAAPTPSNQCWPEPLPYIFWNAGMQMLQQPHQITILYDQDHEVRHVRMNEPHPAQVTPSWYGDSVGHYEGDTLVIDTVGIKTARPFAVIDWFGTPYTEALHVVERYRLLDYEAAKEGLERDAKENFRIPPGGVPLYIDPNYRGKHLQLQFIVDDAGVFTTPWSATITYRPGLNWRGSAEWPEVVCAENRNEYYSGKDTAVPTADKPDF